MLVYLAGIGAEAYLAPLRRAGVQPLQVEGQPLAETERLSLAQRDGQAVAQVAEAALEAGAHLLWAPDPALSPAEEANWAVRFGLAGLTFFPAYPLRYLPPLRRAIELVRGDALGEPRALRLAYQVTAGGPNRAVRFHHLADLYLQVTGSRLQDRFGFDSSPFVSGTGPIPASFDLRESRGKVRVLLEVIGEKGTLLVDGFGQRVLHGQTGSHFVGDSPEDGLIAEFLAACRNGGTPDQGYR